MGNILMIRQFAGHQQQQNGGIHSQHGQIGGVNAGFPADGHRQAPMRKAAFFILKLRKKLPYDQISHCNIHRDKCVSRSKRKQHRSRSDNQNRNPERIQIPEQ